MAVTVDKPLDVETPFTALQIMRDAPVIPVIVLHDAAQAVLLARALVAGGAAMLKAWYGPFGDVRFCPTGGVSLANAADFLALENVICVGGSWLTPANALAQGDWARVTGLAAAACQLPRRADSPSRG